MTDTVETGTFAVDHAARRVRGVLIPWGVKSRTSASKTRPIEFPRGSVRIPRDPSVAGLNLAHDRFQPVGRAAVLEDRDSGLYAEFDIADTEEGDAWLADRGAFVKLSAEVRDIVRDAADRGTATLTGAALVTEGAFEGAALFAIDDKITVSVEPVTVPEPDTTTEPTPVDPDEDDPDNEPDETKEDAVAEAVAPDTMLGGRRGAPAKPDMSINGLFAAIDRYVRHRDSTELARFTSGGEEGIFALDDVKYDGPGGMIDGGRSDWLGQLWAGRTRPRRIVPLLTKGRPLQSIHATGWNWDERPKMARWGGNKSPVPTNTPSIKATEFMAQRFAGGHDLAREYYDFRVTEIILAYLAAMVDSYADESDLYAMEQLSAGATPFTPGAVVGASEGFSAILDGALAVLAAGAIPSFALVAPDVFRDVLSVSKSDALEYFTASLGLDGGNAAGFTIVPDDRVAAGGLIVGARQAAFASELGGSPIRVEALDLVKGGVDNAFFGYIAVGVTYPAAIVQATVGGGAPAPAATTKTATK